MTTIRAIIWDFDGTLVDSPAGVMVATNAALAELGFPAAGIEEVKAGMVLPTIPRMTRHAGIAVDDPRAQALNDRFYVHAREAFPLHARPFPAIPALIRDLAGRGVPMAVVTNNLGDIARSTLARAGLADCFASVLGDGDLPGHKPDPRGPWMAAAACAVEPAACAYVGDSDVDRRTAEAAGMVAVGVTWGTTPRERLVGFALLVDAPAELAGLAVQAASALR